MPRIQDIGAFSAVREAGLAKLLPPVPRVAIGMGTCGRGNGAEGLQHAFAEAIQRSGMDVFLTGVGCFGACFEEPLVNVRLPGKPLLILRRVQADDALRILHDLSMGNITPEHIYCKIEEWEHITGNLRYGRGYPEVPSWNDVPFFKGQKKIVLRNCGLINPDDIEEYIGVGGYQALYKVLIDGRPEVVIEQIKASKLRGRGGAGFLTGNKWEFLNKAKSDRKYIICNADEGDPGAFMDRSVLESDPQRVIEGMAIAAYAVGATKGYFYVRAEYPLAISRLVVSLREARRRGFLGTNICGTTFAFDIEIRIGAGAFVCGEETALIASIEGLRGQPRPRPPYPAVSGLWGSPTLINNVESFANIAPIIRNGPQWFAGIGTERSKGTKVFALTGRIANTGLIEVPMGMTLRQIIFDIGGGIPDGRRFKAVQTGGPSGGCLPAEHLDLSLSYDALISAGSMMGSGGMIVMDDTSCMVNVARFFMEFCMTESCGKCVPCRTGTAQMFNLLTKICDGEATHADLDLLIDLCDMVKHTSLCGLGMTAPNPVLSTLRYFKDEYLEHIDNKRCPAGVCACSSKVRTEEEVTV